MANVVVPLADGFEEIEAMSIIDILRRAGINVVIAGLHDGYISSTRGVKVIPDTTIDKINPDDFDMIVLPGGQPGTDNLNADERVKNLIKHFYNKGKLTGAICAAPYVLSEAGVLEGKKATSYPTYKDKLKNVNYLEDMVVEDSNVLTSRGPGTAACFALKIVEKLVGKEKADEIKKATLFDKCC
ncbi:DJ-1/PfpI family protein [Venenivibrio stagnispumantis]|uniref:4-methyl-5(B-hydroxyethyl)-thiazole monophosphate biosynthesis n=1 Tax=Venenivibrio stagnispumantis TaxID=407998 RepID=A0AA46AEH9_9AQUI|nr:DJ-1 family glyoxalase III [Venenivibrio stagnispumantis]MCW4572879.1 DJ-1/PfpI family protein [Venenivibrio stagnispumantis]SMP12961.1 4-methyl-5(b-hydroxyethyl)-thiazole monophosphate biosynthesis [Venenivibrio stagnispumantis]